MVRRGTSWQLSTGFHDGGVSVCAKHFPGHGDTSADTHLGAGTVDSDDGDAGEAGTGAVRRGNRRWRGRNPHCSCRRRCRRRRAGVGQPLLDRAPAGRWVSKASSSPMRSTWMPWPRVVGSRASPTRPSERCAAGADFLCLGSNFDDVDDEHGHRPRRRRDRRRTARPHALERSLRPHRAACARSTIVSHNVRSHGCATGGRAGNRRRRPAAGGPIRRPRMSPARQHGLLQRRRGASPRPWASAAGRPHRSPSRIRSSRPAMPCSEPPATCRSWSLSAMRACTHGRPLSIDALVDARPIGRRRRARLAQRSSARRCGRLCRHPRRGALERPRRDRLSRIEGSRRWPRSVSAASRRSIRTVSSRSATCISRSPMASSSCSSARPAAASRRCCG